MLNDLVRIDGAVGEGGGQIVRSALALSLVTGRGFQILNLRARRRPPGLRPQHLAAVHAASEVGEARVVGAHLGSQALTFVPGRLKAGDYHFSIGTAGSTTLVLQTLLPALMLAPAPSRVILEGGTHNPLAPPFDFIARAFLPLVNRMGVRIDARLARPGFYPRGGGCLDVQFAPMAPPLGALDLAHRGALRTQTATALLAGLPRHIAERELAVVKQALSWPDRDLVVRELSRAHGPGNVLLLEIESEHVTEVFTAFGERGVPAEAVASIAVAEAQRYLRAGVAVGPHLADQLLIPCALAGRGDYSTVTPTSHTLTNIDIVQAFLPVDISVETVGPDAALIRVRRRAN